MLPALISNCFCYYERLYHNFVIGLSWYLSVYVSKFLFSCFFFFLIFQSTANSLNCSFSTDFTFFWFYTWVSVFNINKTFTVFIAIKFCVVNFIVHYREFPNLFHPSRFRVFCYFPVIKFIGIFGWISGYHRLLS